MSRLRSLLRAVTVAAVALAVVVVPAVTGQPGSAAKAANLSLFDPGNIISDAVFLDSTSMDAGTVQAFLNLKGASCAAGAMPCIKDYTQTTATQTGDAYCSTYQGAGNETAAAIITKIGLACGINPRVLVVLLQKEQGLITATRPGTSAYTNATGFACPDTSPCNPAFSGFASQVYFAARQFQRYRAGVVGSYHAGVVNTIGYVPATSQYNNVNNARCGTAKVFVVNKATAALYDYTPYVPNAAALAAGYGTGDSCSAYGNRNFYAYFTDWFGSTGYRVTGAIDSYYIGQGGGTGWLGGPLAEMSCGTGGGCTQPFAGGIVSWSPTTGTHATSGAVMSAWLAAGGPASAVGYPGGDMFCGLAGGGCAQFFQSGGIWWSPASGAHPVSGAIASLWYSQGYEGGVLGYPVADLTCGATAGGGCTQTFQGGAAFWGATAGTHFVTGAIGSAYATQGGPGGSLGLPSGDMRCGLVGGGCTQNFTAGTVAWTPAVGAHAVTGDSAVLWGAQGRQDGPLGWPTGDPACGLPGGGCSQAFENGTVYRTDASGAHSVSGAIGAAWTAAGGPGAALGYPTAETGCTAAGCFQSFQGGVLSTVAGSTAVHQLSGGIAALWNTQGRTAGPLGLPTTDMDCTLAGGGCQQTFAGGAAYWSPASGTHSVTGAVATAWTAAGSVAGPLGYPTGEPVCTTATACSQAFQQGMVAGASGSGAHAVTGGFALVWTARGGATGPLGYPVDDMTCTQPGSGCVQNFGNGALYWTAGTGVHAVSGPVQAAWAALGGPAGGLGYPVAEARCGLTAGGCTQVFQGGTIAWSTASGAHAVSGGIGLVWAATGSEHGPLGYPTGDMTCVAQGCGQPFGLGALTWTSSAGVRALTGAIAAYWTAQGGAGGALGEATADIDCSQPSGGCLERFQYGTVTWQASAGTHAVSGPLATAWADQGGVRGTLGYPTSEVTSVPSGLQQTFTGGTLTWDSTTGRVTRS